MTETYMTKPETGTGVIDVRLESWGWSQQGNVKANNEDAFLNWPQQQLWAVADGVGSSRHGGVASRFLTKILMQSKPVDSLELHIKQVRSVLTSANGTFFLQGPQEDAASTIVVLLMSGSNAACLWAGDSRCYMLRQGVLYQCTRDHTLRQQKIDQGELTAPEAARMVKQNVITNAVGVNAELKLDMVDFSIKPGDRFLLCSDGLPRIMPAETLSHHLAKQTAKEAVESIVEGISHLNQPDNITFVAVFVSTGI